MDQTTIEVALVRIAHEKSQAFCYNCYVTVPRGIDGTTFCPHCHSDDLMRMYDDEGPEFGVTHVIDRLLADNCQSVCEADLKERFSEMLDDCYPEIKICGTTYNQGEAFKRLDPVGFELAASEYIDTEAGETIISFDNGRTYFDLQSVEEFISLN